MTVGELGRYVDSRFAGRCGEYHVVIPGRREAANPE
jgi:hypothetical protein